MSAIRRDHQRNGPVIADPPPLPPHIQAEVERILRAAARRRLAEKLDRESRDTPGVTGAGGGDGDPSDDGRDEVAPVG